MDGIDQMDSFRRRLLELSRILTDEDASYAYVLQRMQRAGWLRCGDCGFESFYLLSRNRLKCRRCRREFRPLRTTTFAALNLSPAQWLSMVNYFVLEVPTHTAATRCGINYKTALRAYAFIRQAILSEAGIELSSDGRCREVLAVGIIDTVEQGTVKMLEPDQTRELLDSGVARVRKGMLVYTDRWGAFDTVVVLAERRAWRHRKRVFQNSVYVDYIGGFWQYAKQYIIGNRALNRGNLLMLCKELEWRYNHRTEDQFEMIVDRMLCTRKGMNRSRPVRLEMTASS
ncbi:MAG: hypothetical protein ONB07_00725 [candidate division KSB1 bacterium]|nr:hypothetical protein [candidate division KSB1 bacterium]MDZ7392151.1 hypothetical protein [candidate division KSB1 bacterium]MDZ7413608.1 hypothetical protein [candidate division KSB1 bacterium]